jgi:alpha-galactosidase
MPRRCLLSAVAVAALLVLPASAAALDDGLARTPPMGWSSWNHFGCGVDEAIVRQTAAALVASGMRDAGYRYVNVDDCWLAPTRDAAGRLRPDPARFPSGIAALASYLHARGLRLGLYGSLGGFTCAGRPGLAGHEGDDVKRLAAWGVDYLKIDFCGVDAAVRRDPAPAYAAIRDLVRVTGRPIVIGISSWGIGQPWRWGPRTGHLWRVAGDIRDEWASIIRIAGRDALRGRYAGPGGWNDPDSLEVGNGGMTATEDRAHFALWAMSSAPLIAGNDVRVMNRATRRTLLNREVIAVDQDRRGDQGRRVRSRRGREVWVKRLSNGARAVLLLNRRSRAATVRADARTLALPRARHYCARNLLAHRSRRLARVLRTRLPRHGVAIYRIARGTHCRCACRRPR